MDFSRLELTDEQRQFGEEVRSFLESVMTDEVREQEHRTGSGFNEKVHLGLGAKGWLMPTWPVDQGGAGLDPVRARILEQELNRAQVSFIPSANTRLVWSAVEKYLDRELLPDVKAKVASGEVRFCLGYTEPDGGSDIAAAKVRAIRDGDEWVLNGSKIFTTEAQNSQYVFLITRTDPEMPKHQGMTMFLVPLSTPGIEIQPVVTYGGERTNVVYYGDVRVPDRYRLGAVNSGWSVLHGPLDEEHSFGGTVSGLQDLSIGNQFVRVLSRALDEAAAWAATATRPDGTPVRDDKSVQLRLGKIAMEAEAAVSTPGPMGRVFGSEALVRGAADLIDLVGQSALLRPPPTGPTGLSEVEHAHRFAQGTATYGGTVEVFRNIISQHVLGLPQASYPGRKVFLQGRRTEAMARA